MKKTNGSVINYSQLRLLARGGLFFNMCVFCEAVEIALLSQVRQELKSMAVFLRQAVKPTTEE